MRTAEFELLVDANTVARALEWLDHEGEQHGWPARTRYKLRLCLDETLTNVTMYGFTETHEATPCVRLRLHQEADHVVLEIQDNGVPFDSTASAPRDLDTSLDDARIGGHGLRLMLHYLESMRYERKGDWNCLQLVAAIDASP